MRFPRVKKEHRPDRHPDHKIRIGGGLYGVAAEITDPQGRVWAALELLDGTRTPAQIVDELRARFPDLDAATGTGMVDQLIASGYVEDAATPVPAELGDAEAERYDRNRAFFRRVDLRAGTSAWDAQVRLKKARVAVLGLGGTGSHAAWSLAAAGVGSLHCVDPDVVEVTNLTRQAMYTEADIGRPKAETVADRLRDLNSGTSVSVEQRAIATEPELTGLASGADVLALCADRPRDVIQPMTNRVCAALGMPWVGGGYDGPLVTVGVYGPGGVCSDCLAAAEEARLPPGPVPDLGGGVLAPSAGISGHLVAYEIISLITGVARNPPGYTRGINLIAPDHTVYVRHPPRSDCAVCG